MYPQPIRIIGLLTATYVACLAYPGLAPVSAAEAQNTQPAAPPIAVFDELELNQGQKQAFSFTLKKTPQGLDAVLVLKARLDTPKVAGHTRALRLTLNGTPLEGNRLVNKPVRVPTRGGQIYSMSSGSLMTTYYCPDFSSPDDHPHYGLLQNVSACLFEFRVTDLVTPGRNELILEHGADSRITRVLAAADGRIETRRPIPPAQGRAPAPSGRLPRYEPRTTFRTDYTCRELPEAKIEIEIGGQSFVLASQFSTPTPAWVHAGNKFFSHRRRIERSPEAILVFDTFTNLTSENLPLMHRHEIQLPDRTSGIWLAGLKRPTGTGLSTDSSNPTSFAATQRAGIGLIALDDVFRLHVKNQAPGGSISIADANLALKPGVAYTAEWAVVPTAQPDYWPFLNTCRRLVDANFTIPGGFAFMRASHHTEAWTDEQTADFIRFKDAMYACSSIGKYGGRNAHGTAFQRVPLDPYREAFARRLRLVPEVKNLVYFHCFLDTTDEAPQTYADSRTLLPGGEQANYGKPFQRIFFPTRTNSFGAAVGKNVDIILDSIGAAGVYWDEHEYSSRTFHYGEPWDGVSCDIDPRRMTITRLKSSVTLLSEAWRLDLARRIMEQGPLIGNGVPRTRAMAELKFPCFVETGSITNCARAHLYSPIALGDHLTERSEEDAYGTMLAALDIGCLYHWYNDLLVIPTHHHLTRYMYPITPLELHAGYVIGKERIVTNRSGLFGFADDAPHEVHVFDHEGREVEDFDAPTVSQDGKTYTELRLPGKWSAALIRAAD